MDQAQIAPGYRGVFYIYIINKLAALAYHYLNNGANSEIPNSKSKLFI